VDDVCYIAHLIGFAPGGRLFNLLKRAYQEREGISLIGKAFRCHKGTKKALPIDQKSFQYFTVVNFKAFI